MLLQTCFTRIAGIVTSLISATGRSKYAINGTRLLYSNLNSGIRLNHTPPRGFRAQLHTPAWAWLTVLRPFTGPMGVHWPSCSAVLILLLPALALSPWWMSELTFFTLCFTLTVFHWFYVGSPRATTSYKTCISVLLSSNQLHLRLLKSMVRTHRKGTAFARCTY